VIIKNWSSLFEPGEIDLSDTQSVLNACNKAAKRLAAKNNHWGSVKVTARNVETPQLNGLFKIILSQSQQEIVKG
jgi:hypothetical protein